MGFIVILDGVRKQGKMVQNWKKLSLFSIFYSINDVHVWVIFGEIDVLMKNLTQNPEKQVIKIENIKFTMYWKISHQLCMKWQKSEIMVQLSCKWPYTSKIERAIQRKYSLGLKISSLPSIDTFLINYAWNDKNLK